MGACKTATFLFYTGNNFFEQVWSANQNFQFKLKFGTKTNSKKVEFSGDADFFRFPPKILFLGKFGSKINNSQFKLKPGT